MLKKSDWKTLPPPKQVKTLPLHFPVSRKELELIKPGHFPETMDHKWFIYFEDNCLVMHRSWTGLQVYRAFYNEESEEFSELEVNRDAESYGISDDEYDKQNFIFVISVLFLNRKGAQPPAPPKASVEI